MAVSLNKVTLIGNVGRDPEYRIVESGGHAPLARFAMATTETFKTREGEKRDQTEWHNIVAWRGLADLADKYIRKGSRIYIEGRLRTRSYEDANQNKKSITEIEADKIILLDSPKRDYPNTSENKPGSFNSPNEGTDKNSTSHSDDDYTSSNPEF
jgi:single-strand DNA-binding protein